MSKPVTITLLLTDLVDSTRLISEIGDERAAEVMIRHDRRARDLLPIYRGREIDKSDGFLMIFEEAADGVRYALAYHQANRELSAEFGLPLSARAGLHTGPVRLIWNAAEDVALGAKPCEVEGIAKATAARIMTVAMGGQVLLSDATRAALGDAFDQDDHLRTVSHGRFRMKGVSEPAELFEIGEVSAAPLRPPPDSAKVYRVLRTEEGWRPAREVANNLPAERVSFFGRDRELRAIADRFAEDVAVVTLAGPGGTGKTHLARRYAGAWLGDWPGGAWFCDLSEARDPLGVARALGRVLSVPLEQDDPLDTLGAALGGLERALIILDNAEQLQEILPEILESWQDTAPRIAWLVTSRQRLDVLGEQLVYVPPLPLPDATAPTSEILASPSVALFIDRARAVNPRFTLDAESAADIIEIVRLLDGLPLALELAAARSRVLSPRDILKRMGRRFDLLRGRGGRGAAARQATLRGAIDWSWELLEPPEQAALAQCTVFEGGFTLEAAEAVILTDVWPDAPWPMDLVESLADKSLLQVQPGPDGENRLSLLRSIHEYAAEKLDEPDAISGPAGPMSGAAIRVAAEQRHAERFSRWGDPEALEELYRHGGQQVRARLRPDLDNLIAAAYRASGPDWPAGGLSIDPDIAAGCALAAVELMKTSGPLTLAESLAEHILRAGPADVLSARLRLALGEVRNRAGRAEAARPVLQDALDAAIRLSAPRLQGAARYALGHGALLRGSNDEARSHFDAALALQRATGDRRGESLSLSELGHVVGIRGGDFAPAAGHLDAALAIQAERGDQAGEALTRSYLGALLSIQGELDAGRAAYEAARDLAAAVGDRRTAGLCEGMIANICALTGNAAEARAHFERALRTQRSIGDRVHEAMHATNYADFLSRIHDLPGAARTLHRAIALAREIGDPTTEGTALGSLGAVLAASGDLETGLARLAEGEARLRTGDPTELGKLLCRRGEVLLIMARRAEADDALRQAREIAERLEIGEGSELSGMVSALAARLQAQ